MRLVSAACCTATGRCRWRRHQVAATVIARCKREDRVLHHIPHRPLRARRQYHVNPKKSKEAGPLPPCCRRGGRPNGSTRVLSACSVRAVASQPLGQDVHHALRVVASLEADHKVIGISHERRPDHEDAVARPGRTTRRARSGDRRYPTTARARTPVRCPGPAWYTPRRRARPHATVCR